MSNFMLLKNRKIIDMLIGDKEMQLEDYKFTMPRLSGPNLCDLSTEFGLLETYSWSGGARSRWEYLSNLIDHLDSKNLVPILLKRLFQLQSFEGHINGESNDEIKIKHTGMVNTVITNINNILSYSGYALRKVHDNFIITETDNTLIVEHEIHEIIDVPYILNLKERTKEDLLSGNYDSVITKSRTLIEETLIFILEDSDNLQNNHKGNILKLLSEVKTLLNLHQSSEYDKRINGMLSGLEKIIQTIAEMRNINSDAHGVGSKRINITKREAELVINASMTITTYFLQVYEDFRNRGTSR